MLEDNSPSTQAEKLSYPDVRRRTRPVSVDNSAQCQSLPESPSDSVASERDGAPATFAGASLPPAEQPASDYDVGFGKPPKHTRFQKGQSGNPKGRPKGAKSASTIATTLLETKVKAKIDGVMKQVSALELALQQQLKRAISGDAKALQFLLSRIETPAPSRSVNGGPSDENDAPSLTPTAPSLLITSATVCWSKAWMRQLLRSFCAAWGLSKARRNRRDRFFFAGRFSARSSRIATAEKPVLLPLADV